MDKGYERKLQQAVKLIQRGKLNEARPILVALLKEDDQVEEAWYLLSYVLPESHRKEYALKQALQLRPDFERASQRLARLSGAPEPTPAPVAPPPDEETEDQTAFSVAPPKVPEVQPVSPDSFADEDPAPSNRLRSLLIVLLVVGLLAAFWFFRDTLAGLFAGAPPIAEASTPTPSAQAFRELPPTWTPQAAAAEATPTATGPELVPNFTDVDEETLAQMEAIQAQASSLRGLDRLRPVANSLVSAEQLNAILSDIYMNAAFTAELERQQALLVALGLIPPSFSLEEHALNSHTENIGGFYLPDQSRIALVSEEFVGVAPLVYAHEFGHALIDQNFALNSLTSGKDCLLLDETCRVALALIEGDASLLSAEWLAGFGDDGTTAATLGTGNQQQSLQGDGIPPYVSLDFAFPYVQGAGFVQALYDEGFWERVDQAYADPPTSTEHILHPELYLASEAPLPVDDPPLSDVLDSNWLRETSGVLGEWLTYLLLSNGNDQEARLDAPVASEAAAGWGGDAYQLYTNGADLVLAAHWVWDSAAEADQFAAALGSYSAARFTLGESEVDAASCWTAPSQIACLFVAQGEALWVLAPDAATVSLVASLYPQFQ